MTTPTDTKPDRQARRTAEQNAQARLVLIQLLWLAVLLLIGSIIWLANGQKKLAVHLDERLKITETFNARMNAMDDRIFAINNFETKSAQQHNAQNDLQWVIIQLAQANRLYQDGNYQESGEILQLLEWQLSHDKLALALPLQSALKNTLKDDLVHLTAMQAQTDAWQQEILTMRAVQGYLRTLNTSTIDQTTLAVHDATLLLSLAMGATSLREKDTRVVYLQEAVDNLEKAKRLSPQSNSPHNSPSDSPNDSPSKATSPSDSTGQSADGQPNDNKASTQNIQSLSQAIHALNHLLANPPSLEPLKSRELLKEY